ncbi:MAG: O-antigen ligase C-terminal domain-containing protein [Burkholderiales bacterium]|nr:O-antigen ligase C-terminal domain-containing protein [Burkholderiales bacterium]
MGLPLTLMICVPACIWLWRRVCGTKDRLSWYCLALALPLGVHSLLEFPYAYAYFLAPGMVVLGVLEATKAPGSVYLIPHRVAIAAWIFVTTVLTWSVFEYAAAEEDFRVAMFEVKHIGHTPSEYQRPKLVMLTQLGALLEGARIVPAPGMAAQRIELAREVALRFPWPATQNRYALSLALNGNPDEATRQLRIIRSMHGEAQFSTIRENWHDLAQGNYPQLRQVSVP